MPKVPPKAVTGLWKLLASTFAGGTVLPATLDWRMNSDPNAVWGWTTLKDLVTGNMNRDRVTSLGLNTLLGSFGGSLLHLGGKNLFNPKNGTAVAAGAAQAGLGITSIGMAPAKDLMFNLQGTPEKLNNALDAVSATAGKYDRALPWVLGGLGAGVLGLGSYGLYKWLQNKKEDREKQEKGHIKIRVKGKDGDPNKTMDVVLPVDNPELSPAMMEGLNMSLRRNAKEVIRANSMKRDPETGKMIDYETWKSKYGRGKTTDATGTPLMNTPSPTAYAGSPFGKAAFWKSAALANRLRQDNPAQTPESQPFVPSVIRKVTGPTIIEYLMPNGSPQIPAEILAKILAGEVQTPVAAQTAQSYMATGADTPPSFLDDDDDDFGKMASAPSEGGGQPPQGAAVPTWQNQTGRRLSPAGSNTKLREVSNRLETLFQRLRIASNPTTGMYSTLS